MRYDKREGEEIPFGWAVAFRDFDRGCGVCYPIPIHFLVRWGRDLRYWLMRVGRPGYRERTEHAVFLRGLQQERIAYARQEELAKDWAWQRGHEEGIALGKRMAFDAAMNLLDEKYGEPRLGPGK